MNLTTQQKVFFLFALKQRPKDANQLFEYLPKASKTEMLALYQELSKHKEEDIVKVAKNELKKLSNPKNQSYLSEVHVDWIADRIKEESPEIIAAILRYLPAENVSVLLDKLPKDVLENMPKLADTYAIPSGLVELFQKKFESFFALKKIYEKGLALEFEHFCLLRADQIQKVFLDLGYREIAFGLCTLPKKARAVVLDRLSPNDRRLVDLYVNQVGNVSERRLKNAQFHLISKEVQTRDSSLFVKGLGFLVYSKMLLQKDIADFEIIKNKLSKSHARILEDFVSMHLDKNTEASVLSYREDFMLAVKSVLSGNA